MEKKVGVGAKTSNKHNFHFGLLKDPVLAALLLKLIT